MVVLRDHHLRDPATGLGSYVDLDPAGVVLGDEEPMWIARVPSGAVVISVHVASVGRRGGVAGQRSSPHSSQTVPVRALVQRVTRASVTSRSASDEPDVEVGAIGPGLCVFVGATHDDDDGAADHLALKIWGLRVFDDDDGVMNLAASDVGAELLVVSQFTLYGNTRKGRRPSWVDAAPPEHAEPLVDRVVDQLRAVGATVATGRFRTEMEVALVNDGPVTLMLEV